MGYRFGDTCFSTAQGAADAWASTYPQQIGTEVYGMQSYTVSGGTVTGVIKPGTGANLTKTVPLTICDNNAHFEALPGDVIGGAAMFVAFAMGVVAGLLS